MEDSFRNHGKYYIKQRVLRKQRKICELGTGDFERNLVGGTVLFLLCILPFLRQVLEEESGSPLSPVLLSLSGSHGFRSNNFTKPDGTLEYRDLVSPEMRPQPCATARFAAIPSIFQ